MHNLYDLYLCHFKKTYPKFKIVTNFAYRVATLSAICSRVIVPFKFRRNGCYTQFTLYLAHDKYSDVIWHLREWSKRTFPTYRRALVRMRASKHELPTMITAHIVPSSTVNQRGIRVRAIVKVSNNFCRASSSSREGNAPRYQSREEIDLLDMHRVSVKI